MRPDRAADGPGPDAAVILAGGAGRRLGGRDKPAMLVGGRRLLDVALAAVPGCPVVVVGPPRELPSAVLQARELPAGGGPAAALAAGLAALPDLPGNAIVAVLAADLPGFGDVTVARLCAALRAARAGSVIDEPAGAILVDVAGRRQYLTAVWRSAVLRAAVERRQTWDGGSLRELLASMAVVEVAGSAPETADVDTPEDWQRWQL